MPGSDFHSPHHHKVVSGPTTMTSVYQAILVSMVRQGLRTIRTHGYESTPPFTAQVRAPSVPCPCRLRPRLPTALGPNDEARPWSPATYMISKSTPIRSDGITSGNGHGRGARRSHIADGHSATQASSRLQA